MSNYAREDFDSGTPFELKLGSTKVFVKGTGTNGETIVKYLVGDWQQDPDEEGIFAHKKWEFYSHIEQIDNEGFDFYAVFFARVIRGRVNFSEMEKAQQ
jgi:hypothetical protein